MTEPLEPAIRGALRRAAPPELVTGLGVDVEFVDRWHRPDLRLFTPAEVEYCLSRADPAEAFAGTWCAKEATVKALAGIARVTVREVEILRDASGAPHAALHPPVEHIIRVSISHTDGWAVAVAASQGPGSTLPGQPQCFTAPSASSG